MKTSRWKKTVRCLTTGFAILAAHQTFAATPDELVAEGRVFLVNSNLTSAHARFESALAISPQHAPANVLAAATRLLLLPQRTAVSNALTRLGVARNGRNLFDWTADFTEDEDGNVVLPSTLNSSEAVTLIRNEVMPAIRLSLTNLSRVTATDFLLDLSAEETHTDAATVDYGDVQMLRALLRGALAFGHTLGAHNLSVNISRLRFLGDTGQLTFQKLLSDNSGLFGAGTASDRTASREQFILAATHYHEASELIRQRPPDTARLFTLDPEQVEEEARFRDQLDAALASLEEPVKFDAEDDHFTYLGSYFEGTRTLRSFLPRFDGDRYLPGSLPDYTFGGLLVGLPSSRIESALMENFGGNYQGFYATSSENPTKVAAFVRSNSIVTILGYGEQPFFVEFKLDADGSGDLEKDDGEFFAYADFYPDEFFGEVWDFGAYTYFDGERVAEGSTGAEAGYYQGTFSAPGDSGKLRAILTPDGRLFFVALDSDNEPTDSGAAQLDESGDFETETQDGTSVAGALNRSTKVISGTFSSEGNNGTFTLSRSAFLPEPAPPVITSQPQDQTIEAGKTVTLAVTATGAPLQYQWLSNDVPIWGATARTFTRKPPGPAHVEAYSVAVFNPSGAVTSRVATLTVLNESEIPKVTVVSHADKARVPTEQINVTGTASDNAAVATVLYRLNDGDWTPAEGTTTWTAALTLEPCTNLFEVKAVDTSDNESVIVVRRIYRIVNTPLALTITGQGTVTPNLTNQNLEQCKTYQITATPAVGNVFSNWSDGSTEPRLTFVMTPGLTLQANFVANPFPGVGGIYNGLFREEDQVRHTRAGSFTATITANGSYSGRLNLGGRNMSFRGRFDLDGRSTNSLPNGTNTVILGMQLDLNTNGTGQITGTVASSDTNGNWTSELVADRAYFHTTLRPTDLDGPNTLVIPGSEDDSTAPGGSGSGTVTITKGGAVTLSATLAEGTKISQKTTLSRDGEWSLFAPLYSGKGSIMGRMAFDESGTNLSGELTWTRPGVARNLFYTNGFVHVTEAVGSSYTPPGTNRILNLSEAVLSLAGGNLSQIFSNNVVLTPANKIVNASSNKVTMTLNLARGLFTGTFMETGTVKTVKFSGAVLQNANTGHGSFAGTNRIGSIFFGPRAP